VNIEWHRDKNALRDIFGAALFVWRLKFQEEFSDRQVPLEEKAA
jgi:hypothetical protein